MRKSKTLQTKAQTGAQNTNRFFNTLVTITGLVACGTKALSREEKNEIGIL